MLKLIGKFIIRSKRILAMPIPQNIFFKRQRSLKK